MSRITKARAKRKTDKLILCQVTWAAGARPPAGSWGDRRWAAATGARQFPRCGTTVHRRSPLADPNMEAKPQNSLQLRPHVVAPFPEGFVQSQAKKGRQEIDKVERL